MCRNTFIPCFALSPREKDRKESLLQAVNAETISADQLVEITFKLAMKINQARLLADLVKQNGGADATGAVPEDNTQHTRPEAETARKDLEALKGEKRQTEESQRALEDEDKFDYGPDLEYYVLKGQCFHKGHGEHSYELCPFGTSKQGGRSIGQWAGWHKQTEWHSPYRMMKFTNGDRFGCPDARELTVNVDCGETAAITKVEEPSMCKYSMNFVCPQACTEDLG